MGLMILLLAVLYFVVLIFSTRWAYRSKLRNGSTKKQAKWFAVAVFALLFLPVFWDWVPTKIAYHYYCNTQAGVTQYKTLEQWREENPGVYETLKPYTYENRKERDERESKLYIIRGNEKVNASVSNQRFSVYLSISKLPLNINKLESEFIDEETKEVIIRRVAFSAGPVNDLAQGGIGYKMWLTEPYCNIDRDKYFSTISEFEEKK